METAIRVRLRVHGRVQGVGYRYFVEREACRLGVSGWVRNCPDGSVEAEAEGSRARLEELMASLRRGPSLARIDRVDVEWGEAIGTPAGFQIRHDVGP